MIALYKTKPCEIEACQWNGANAAEIDFFCTDNSCYFSNGGLQGELYIHTLEGDMKANIGDYIIKGLRGEFYPCKPDVFEKKYSFISEK